MSSFVEFCLSVIGYLVIGVVYARLTSVRIYRECARDARRHQEDLLAIIRRRDRQIDEQEVQRSARHEALILLAWTVPLWPAFALWHLVIAPVVLWLKRFLLTPVAKRVDRATELDEAATYWRQRARDAVTAAERETAEACANACAECAKALKL